MTYLAPPAEPLTDGVVTLRLPSPDAGDVESINSYIEEGQLEGGWLPSIPLVSAEQAVRDWTEGWRPGQLGRPSPMLIATVADEPRFIGVVGFGDRGDGAVEMIYGIAPRWRRRGFASRAARLAGHWVNGLPDVRTVELRIDRQERASQRVAMKAGFVPAGTVTQFVPATGATFEDLRYVLVKPTS